MGYLALFIFGNNVTGQWYNIDTPISGNMSLRMSDGSFSGGVNVEFKRLWANVYLDPTSGTTRIIGYVAINPNIIEIDLSGKRSVPGEFPNPPTEVDTTLIIKLETENSGLFFDTGPMTTLWNPDYNNYGLSDATVLQTIRIQGEYSLITGDYTHTESFEYEMGQRLGGAYTYAGLRNTDYPNSIILEAMGTHGGMFCYEVPTEVATHTAPNGVNISLKPGAWQFGVIQAENFSWNSEPVTSLPGMIGLPVLPPIACSIITQPQDVALNQGTVATFDVEAIGYGALGYQWRRNGEIIFGANQATLNLGAATASMEGFYDVIITNDVSSITSRTAKLNIIALPKIEAGPENLTRVMGQSATFAVVVSGSQPFTFVWKRNGSIITDGGRITGATSKALTISDLQEGDAGTFQVVVSNQAGSASSTGATLTVLVPPSIQTNPVSTTVSIGEEVKFEVAANGTGPLTYQWFFNDQVIMGANHSTFTIPNVNEQNVGQYYIKIINTAGQVSSSPVGLWIADLKMYAGVNVFGPIGKNCLIEYSTNISEPLNWTFLTNITVQAFPHIMIDYQSGDSKKRFYRVTPTE